MCLYIAMIRITYKMIEESCKQLNPKRFDTALVFKNVVGFLQSYCEKRFGRKDLLSA